TPYLWLSEIGVDASINDHEVFEREADLADVLDDLDFSIQAHLEGQRGRHGVLLDVSYSDLGDEDKHIDLAGPAEIVAKGDLEMTLLEAAAIFNPRGDGTGLTVIYGARIVDIDEEIDARIVLGPASTASRRYEASSTLLDGMLGVRHIGRLSDRWSSVLRADASAGGTELTWNAMLGLGYTFGASGRYALFAGYRYMEIEFEEEDQQAEIESQVKLGGFLTGLRIGF
ncbi:MAG TPA: hypothetical protein VMW27_17605, partial [Thermoanaerobaculia bacterium]|nr:hypothetical protein [Thermoanaerobaculia bacterium]